MGRIQKAYETRFRWLLQQVNARRIDEGIQRLLRKADQMGRAKRLSAADALMAVYEGLASKPRFQNGTAVHSPVLFFCDAGLGGLARWLRAAGYDTRWEPYVDDDRLLQEVRKNGATILTTDSMLMERKVIRDRVIAAYWLPPTLSIEVALRLVFKEFRLEVRIRRCMTCGGELDRVDKESLRDRIPPRTFRWLNDYFVCRRCGKLFWHGTHWHRIHRELQGISKQGADEHEF